MLTTKRKIAVARGISGALRAIRSFFGLSSMVDVRRHGARWHLDLSEGIDLATYLGLYERSTIQEYRRLVRPGMTALDVGANIGTHTLQLAQLVGVLGRVVAFEPTDFAYSKLCRNIHTNPELASRITTYRVMLGDGSCRAQPTAVFSSWPLDGNRPVHRTHRGQLMSTAGARFARLDDLLDERKVAKIDFIKLDVDGFECAVLRGATKALLRDRPMIVMELAPYVLTEAGESHESLLKILRTARYEMAMLRSGRQLPSQWDELRRWVPDGIGRNILLRPVESTSSID